MTTPTIELGDEDEVKGDMTPMIDIIFLLLIFFILTTRFISPEKVITALLPTDKGSPARRVDVVPPLDDINVCIYPEGLPAGEAQPSALDRAWQDNVAQMRRSALLRVGRRGAPIRIDGTGLGARNAEVSQAEVTRVADHLAAELERRETAEGPRNEQPPVVIHCFSGLSWKYALVAYDAVRAYEARHGVGSSRYGGRLSAEDLLAAREVDFAPPRVRNLQVNQLGQELWEILRLR